MSLQSTSAQLVELLRDADNKVIALTGKWGTGKSHLWDEIESKSQEPQIKNSLYVSLFGVSGIDQLKLKLIESAVPAIEKNPSFWEHTKNAYASGVKVLEGFHQGFGALNDVGLLLAPKILQNKLIVLDDIERKHDQLSIEEVLGFIDDSTQQRGARFLLILNSDRLHEPAVWNELREKVVDQELRLNTSPAEAFNIAIGLTPSTYADSVRISVEACGLTNIRIIRKVIKAANNILGNRASLPAEILARIVPSIVLLSAIHYRGLDDGPDFDFVTSYGTPGAKVDPESEDARRRARWKLLLQRLGMLSSDKFELLVVEYLESGLLDNSALTAVLDRYVKERDIAQAAASWRSFIERAWWDHHSSEAELLAEARNLLDKAEFLEAGMATQLHHELTRLSGGHPLAETLIDRWIVAFRARVFTEVDETFLSSIKLHPRIAAEYKSINAVAQTNTSVYDACLDIVRNSGWGVRQEAAMKASTPEAMESIMRTRSASELKLFMLNMLHLYGQRSNYERHFGSAMENFAIACRKIVRDGSSVRLKNIVIRLFDEHNLANVLDEPDSAAPAEVPRN